MDRSPNLIPSTLSKTEVMLGWAYQRLVYLELPVFWSSLLIKSKTTEFDDCLINI